jgi:chemotaxis-related protein WspD
MQTMESEGSAKTDPKCWKRIGVWGTERPRCPDLERVIHCRNCEVFTRAGRDFLDRDLPDAFKEKWAVIMAAEKEDDERETVAIVIFRIGEEWMALDAHLFSEIIEPERTHTIPGRSNRVFLGIVSVHGEIHLCVSLGALLELEEEQGKGSEKEVCAHMIVVKKDGDPWVFPVDEVHGVHRLSPNAVENVPVAVSRSHSAFTKGIFQWKEKSVALLDDDLLFYRLARSTQ